MARNSRQSKILEIISSKEIETQDELARELRLAGFDITQATISRDIKDIGLVKVATDSGKYKYATQDITSLQMSSKISSVCKDVVVSVKPAGNLVYIQAIAGAGKLAASSISKLCLENVLGVISGDDNCLVVCLTESDSAITADKIVKFLED